jgi:hypothetical protein
MGWEEQAEKERQEFEEREAAYAASHERRAAGRIIMHMWIIAVGIPLVAALVYLPQFFGTHWF